MRGEVIKTETEGERELGEDLASHHLIFDKREGWK